MQSNSAASAGPASLPRVCVGALVVLCSALVPAVQVRAADLPTSPRPAEQSAASAAESTAKTVTRAATPRARKTGTSAARKTRNATATEFEVSAYTSEIADQINGRINLSRTNSRASSWLRTGYGFARSRTFSKNKVNETELGTLNLDAGLKRGDGKSYRFAEMVARVRTRKPNLKGYPERSGYGMLSAGVGTVVFPVLNFEVALAYVNRINKEGRTERFVKPVYTFALKAPLTGSVTLDGDLRLVEPFTDDPLVDLRMNLTYKLTSSTSLRLTYLANNLLNKLLVPTSSRPNSEWDKSFRISLVFSRAVK